MQNERIAVKGAIDQETRCKHYHKNLDRVAIKFYCCNTYFSCFQCHEELGCSNTAVWPETAFGEKAILCGSCGTELSIEDYLNSGYHCPKCQAAFNPGCGAHSHLYFSDER